MWSVKDPEWTCKIDEGPAGVNAPRWSPDGQNIILVADFQIRMTIWSLVNRTCLHINGPKFSDRGFAFSPDGSLMALLEVRHLLRTFSSRQHVSLHCRPETGWHGGRCAATSKAGETEKSPSVLRAQRHDCKDFMSLFAAKGWQPLAHVALPTQDAAGLAFSPDGTCFAVWDSALEFQVLVYGLDGSCLASHRAHTDGLGIKSVAWSTTGQLLAVGSYEQVRRTFTWRLPGLLPWLGGQ